MLRVRRMRRGMSCRSHHHGAGSGGLLIPRRGQHALHPLRCLSKKLQVPYIRSEWTANAGDIAAGGLRRQEQGAADPPPELERGRVHGALPGYRFSGRGRVRRPVRPRPRRDPRPRGGPGGMPCLHGGEVRAERSWRRLWARPVGPGGGQGGPLQRDALPDRRAAELYGASSGRYGGAPHLRPGLPRGGQPAGLEGLPGERPGRRRDRVRELPGQGPRVAAL